MASNPPGSDEPGRGESSPQTIFGRYFNGLITALNSVGTAWIFVMMILINADVFMRYLFNSPVRGVPLVITLSIIAIVFLQMSDALRYGRFTRSDVMIGALLRRRPIVGHSMQMIYNIAGTILMGILLWYSIPFFEKAWDLKTYAGNEGDFTLPIWPVDLVILIGATCCGIQYFRHFWEDIRYLRGFRDNEHMGEGGGVTDE